MNKTLALIPIIKNSLPGIFLFTLLSIGAALLPQTLHADDTQAAAFYEEARSLNAKGEDNAAIIQLKNALKASPKFLPARILLGKIHLEKGEAASAEKELLEANRLGADRSLTAIALGKAYLKQFKHDELLLRIREEEYPLSLQSELLTLRGHAFLEIQELGDAELAFNKSIKLAPTAAAPAGGLALLHLRRGDRQKALQQALLASDLNPNDADALNILASVYHANGEIDEAISHYSRVLERDHQHLDARLARASVYFEQGQLKEALDDLEKLSEQYPLEPRTSYLQSLVYTRSGMPSKAQEALQNTANIIEHLNPQVLARHHQLPLLAGLTYYSLGLFDKAQPYLNQVVLSKQPQEFAARKLLAAIYLSQNDDQQTINILKPALQNQRDHQLLSLLGTAYMRKGRHDLASEYLQEAVSLSNNAPETRFNLALNQFSSGANADAFAHLTAILEKDPQNTAAKVALGLMHIKSGALAKAVDVLNTLTAEEQKNITYRNLLGTAQIMNRQHQAARQTFEAIQTLAPEFLPAQINLSRLDLIAGNIDQAKSRLLKVAESSPTPLPLVMLELARSEDLSGNLEDAIRWAKRAHDGDRRALPPQLYLTELYLRTQQADKALLTAQGLKLLAPENLDVLQALAAAYVASKDMSKARNTYRRMSRLAAFDHQWLYRIARLQFSIKQYSDAEWSLQKAIKGDASFIPAHVALTEIWIGLNELEKAQESARDILNKHQQTGIGNRLLGDIAAQKGLAKQAVKHYQRALKHEKNTALVLKLYQALVQTGQLSRATRIVNDWAASNPQDLLVQQALAEIYLQQNQLKKSAQIYEQILSKQAENSAILNNLAIIYLRLGDHDRALVKAQDAHRLDSHSASINDSLGWILVNRGDTERGLRYLREAHSRASTTPEINYHIAVALEKLGRYDEARVELERAFASQQAFDGIESARALKKRLAQ